MNDVYACIDGMSAKIHGNPEQQRKDKLLRAKAKMKGFQVVEVSAMGLSDDVTLSMMFGELAILLAEDNEVNRRVALLYLKRMDLEADWVENGKEAIERVAETPYDIILMDMQMPLMDGVEATREIRKMTGQEEYPWIIALTAGALQENREQAFAAGFNDYVTKPVHFTLLRDKLHEHIRKAARKAGALSD